MSLTNAPAVISSLSTMVKATATYTTMVATDTWYPNLDLQQATLPAIVLFPVSRGRTPYAAGSAGVPRASLRLTIYADTTAGTLEGWGESLLDELVLAGQNAGLPITDGTVSPSSDPIPGARAAEEETSSPTMRYRTIDIDLECGLSI